MSTDRKTVFLFNFHVYDCGLEKTLGCFGDAPPQWDNSVQKVRDSAGLLGGSWMEDVQPIEVDSNFGESKLSKLHEWAQVSEIKEVT